MWVLVGTLPRTRATLLATFLGTVAGCVSGDPVGASGAAITAGRDHDSDPNDGALVRDEGMICSGSVDAPDAVLTAAHCFAHGRPDAVLLGPDPRAPLARVAIRAAILHPEHDGETLEHDLAVARLAHDVEIAPAALPSVDMGTEDLGSAARI